MFDKNGRIVVNPTSTVHVPESNATESLDAGNVVEETHTRVTSASYTKRPKALRWTKEETYKFYMGLRQYGTSFGMIASLFPGRERRHIKNKYNREERSHPELVTLALKNAIPMQEALPAPPEFISLVDKPEDGGDEEDKKTSKKKTATKKKTVVAKKTSKKKAAQPPSGRRRTPRGHEI
jgi:hypothetical protein